MYVDLKIPVNGLMTEDVIFLHPNQIATAVDEIFKSRSIHHIPVLDDDHKPIGIISKSDYYMLLGRKTIFNVKKESFNNREFLASLLVEEIMNKDVMCIDWEAPLENVAKIFLENIVHAMPVTRDGKLIGIITSHDILKYMMSAHKVLN